MWAEVGYVLAFAVISISLIFKISAKCNKEADISAAASSTTQNNVDFVGDNEATLPNSYTTGSSRIAVVNETARNINSRQNNFTMRQDSVPKYHEVVVDDLPSYNEAVNNPANKSSVV